MERIRVIVRGRVQGVGFRYFARTLAEQHGVTGHAKNLDDGTVEVEAQAPSDVLDRYLTALAEGPRHGRVDGLDRAATAIRENERSFRTM